MHHPKTKELKSIHPPFNWPSINLPIHPYIHPSHPWSTHTPTYPTTSLPIRPPIDPPGLSNYPTTHVSSHSLNHLFTPIRSKPHPHILPRAPLPTIRPSLYIPNPTFQFNLPSILHLIHPSTLPAFLNEKISACFPSCQFSRPHSNLVTKHAVLSTVRSTITVVQSTITVVQSTITVVQSTKL